MWHAVSHAGLSKEGLHADLIPRRPTYVWTRPSAACCQGHTQQPVTRSHSGRCSAVGCVLERPWTTTQLTLWWHGRHLQLRVTASQIVALSRCVVIPLAVHAPDEACAIAGALTLSDRYSACMLYSRCRHTLPCCSAGSRGCSCDSPVPCQDKSSMTENSLGALPSAF